MEQLGLTRSGIHLCENHYKHYNLTNIGYCRGHELEFQHRGKVSDSVSLINESEVAVTHVSPTKTHIESFQPFKKIFLYRDYKSRMESWGRTGIQRLDDDYYMTEEYHNGMFSWAKQDNVFKMSFYDMLEVNVDTINQLQRFLFNDMRYDSADCMNIALRTNSLTKSAIR